MSELQQADEEPIVELDQELEATYYRARSNIKDGIFQLQICDEDGLICNMTMDTADAYELARTILRHYDLLEKIT